MLNVWIGNLGKYNEGELVGDWLELPKTKDEIDKFLKENVGLQITQKEVDEALTKDGVCYEEYMINDYETDLPVHIGEYESLKELNLLAKIAENVENMDAVEAFLEAEGEVNAEELMNIMLQEDDIPFYEYEATEGNYRTLSNAEKYGLMKAEWTGVSEILEKNNITSYFDYEGYGYDDELSGYVDFYDNGYLDRTAMSEVNMRLYSIKEIEELVKQENNKEQLKVIYKQVGQPAKVIEIDKTLEAEQALVEGFIEVVPYKDNLLLICNEEGKINNLKPNVVFENDYIAGDFFVVAEDYENADFKSIKDEQVEEIIEDLEERTAVYMIEETEEDDMEF